MNAERCRKIALVGTSCVGKTTIFDALRNSLDNTPSVAFVPEAARAFFEKNPGIIRFSADTQGRIQDLAIEQERRVGSSGVEIMICDRSCLDAVAYTLAAGDVEGADNLLTNVAFGYPPTP
ncbi:MAG: AAA family ATPase [Candidatus Blackburnbacteria bacterium]|nr:AAA family ATPase [Candidatus Blackburnbacteria bacterium]